ncbi:MAG: GNAT family N-acetyltransferase [Rubrobacteraceae bacterium]
MPNPRPAPDTPVADPAPGASMYRRTPADLRTERLALVTLTPELARAALEDREELGRVLGARVPPTWPGADFARMLPRIAHSPAAPFTCLIIHEGDRTVIGETGFHGPPDGTGTVEAGYSIIPDYRSRGFAYEATRALIEAALASPGINHVIAECLHDNAPSLRVLEKLGMRRAGSAGSAVRFELRKARYSGLRKE